MTGHTIVGEQRSVGRLNRVVEGGQEGMVAALAQSNRVAKPLHTLIEPAQGIGIGGGASSFDEKTLICDDYDVGDIARILSVLTETVGDAPDGFEKLVRGNFNRRRV